MIPFGNETVTLVRRVETVVNGKTAVTYENVTLTGCSWRRTTRIIRDAEALVSQEGMVCRVPSGQTRPMPGDLMILGAATVNVTSGAQYQRLIGSLYMADAMWVLAARLGGPRKNLP